MEFNADDTAARGRWLDALFDLDGAARDAALAEPGVPLEWRSTAARLCALDEVDGILDRNSLAVSGYVFDPGTTPPAPEAGASAGRYRLERLIGEGGMATVWLARHQDVHLPQQVAVKCLRTTLSTPEWRTRFMREQRILARLTHPNVTRLFDAGITESGTPYIVMEYVDGEPITEYCDRRALSCRERVRLFLKVCASVAHAHRSLIVHRDLKPRNVLVSEDGEPHLLDFGIAKLLDLTDADAEMTRTGLLLLTPAYAAPEQFAHAPVTTATDVYGLGAMLHEVLGGSRARHHADGRLQLPSSRTTDGAAASRGLGSAAMLRRVLRGDLDAILERALRREPERRYASAAAFGEDLERWLEGTVVVARAGTWRYRASRFVHRHWIVLGLIAVAMTALSITTMVSVRESARADRSARLAVNAAERATLSRDFVIGLMHDLRPGGAVASPEEMLDRAAQLARERFAADDDTRAAMLIAIGDLDRGYGRLEKSRAGLEEAILIARARGGDASEVWLEAEAHLGHTAFRQGHYLVGIPRLGEALRRYDAAGGVAGAARVRALIILGQLRQSVGEMAAALELQRAAFEAASRLTDQDHPVRQAVLETYGNSLAESGRYAEARRVLGDNLALSRERFGDRDLAVASALETLATCEIGAGQPQAALPLLREAQSTASAVLDRPHVMAAYVENTLGTALLRLGRSVEAQAAHERALQIFAALHAAPHPMLVATHSNLGEAAFEQQRFDDAAVAFEEAAGQRRALAESTRFAGISLACLAGESRARGASPEAGVRALEACIVELGLEAEVQPDYLAFAHGALAQGRLRIGDRHGAGENARRALSLAVPAAAHERLLPRVVLAQIGAESTDRVEVMAQAQAALLALDTAFLTRPCETAGQLRALAEPVARVGDSEMAERLRERASRMSCEGSATTGAN